MTVITEGPRPIDERVGMIVSGRPQKLEAKSYQRLSEPVSPQRSNADRGHLQVNPPFNGNLELPTRIQGPAGIAFRLSSGSFSVDVAFRAAGRSVHSAVHALRTRWRSNGEQ